METIEARTQREGDSVPVVPTTASLAVGSAASGLVLVAGLFGLVNGQDGAEYLLWLTGVVLATLGALASAVAWVTQDRFLRLADTSTDQQTSSRDERPPDEPPERESGEGETAGLDAEALRQRRMHEQALDNQEHLRQQARRIRLSIRRGGRPIEER